MARKRTFGERLRAALAVGGITLGILLLFVVQFAIPYWMGLAGLIVVGFLDAAVYLDLRHRRALRRARIGVRPPGGPVESHRLAQIERRRREESFAAVGVIVLVVGFTLAVIALQPNSGPLMGFVLFPVGEAMLGIAIFMWWPYEWILGWQSEGFDTTDDH